MSITHTRDSASKNLNYLTRKNINTPSNSLKNLKWTHVVLNRCSLFKFQTQFLFYLSGSFSPLKCKRISSTNRRKIPSSSHNGPKFNTAICLSRRCTTLLENSWTYNKGKKIKKNKTYFNAQLKNSFRRFMCAFSDANWEKLPKDSGVTWKMYSNVWYK